MKCFYRIMGYSLILALAGFHTYAQKIRDFEIMLSAGILKTKFVDEWDNRMIYGNSGFQPVNFRLAFSEEKWVHHINFYYIENKLSSFEGEGLFNYNYVKSKSGEIAYHAFYPLISKEQSAFVFYAGFGIHAFGSLRHRESLSRNYPYKTSVDSYDVNSGSLQVVVSPVYRVNRHEIGTTIAAGILSRVTRPDSYNTFYSSNNGKWPWVSFSKHMNLLWEAEYKYHISDRFSVLYDYRMFYYTYSFPYRLKVLNQNFLLGLSYKF